MRSLRSPLLAVLLAAATGIAVARVRAADALDWKEEEKAALELLRDLIRMDTQMKGETALLEKVKARLEKIGVASRIFEKEPGRGNLLARRPAKDGSRKAAPLLLVAHVDTVKFDKAEGWSADPLGAEIKEGELVGRGVLDDKGQAVLAIAALELLAKEGVAAERDVVLMLNADEENSGGLGAAYMVAEKWDEIGSVGAALNEGGRCTMTPDGKVYLVGIQTAEKIYNDVVVRVKGQSGHSSVPRPGNAIAKMARVLSKIDAWKPALRVTKPALGVFRGFEKTEKDPITKRAIRDLESADEAEKKRAAELLADLDPRFNALLRSTFALTMLKGGVKENQLPPSAEVNLNIRLLPDESLEEFLVGLRHALRDEEVQIDIVDQGVASPPSPTEHALYRSLEAAAKKHYPGAAIVPSMSTGATDSRFLRNKGVPCYGLGTFPLEEKHERSVHANDERLPVTSLGRGLRFYYDAVKTYVATAE